MCAQVSEYRRAVRYNTCMSRTVLRGAFFVCIGAFAFLISFLLDPFSTYALNINTYSDTISDSRVNNYSNHTFSFTLKTDVGAGGYIDIQPPDGFTTLAPTTTWNAKNVELIVNGTPRAASSTGDATTDEVTITPGSPGLIHYQLNPSFGIPDEASVVLRIGSHTSNAEAGGVIISTSSTTTVPADVPGIQNASSTGTYRVLVNIGGGTDDAYAGFVIALTEQVGIENVDTTEEIPPVRFNGLPTGEIGGTTLSVEISLETDELAICRFSLTPDVEYNAMGSTFQNTGFLFHSQVVSVAPDSVNTYYVRCIDDEGNFNTDDYEITFYAPLPPSGTPNAEGEVEGDGTGTGNDGTGSGAGGGGTTGGTEGESSTAGQESGNGGNGGGSGGGGGGGRGSSGGGGFEGTDGPYRSGDGQVVISGFAFPNSNVTVLVDGTSAATARASASGAFEVTIDQIARGPYTFGIYATDANGVKSSTFSTSFTVSGARASSLSNINLAPSIKVSPDPVNPGATLTVTGYALANSTVTVENEKQGSAASRQSFTATASSNGAWTLSIPTSGFSQGTYRIRAKTAQNEGLKLTTSFSNYTLYGVGQAANRPLSADLNRDSKVNLTDFSILLFWWNSDGGNSDPSADINQDGKVNLTDFSIQLFNWTG